MVSVTRLSTLILALVPFASPAVAQRIYWGQLDGLWRASLDGSDAQLLVAADAPRQLRIDRTHARIYYSKSFLPTGHIARISLRDLQHEVLWSTDNFGPAGITLDPLRQEIYFTANDSSVWRLDIQTLSVSRVRPPNYSYDLEIAPASRTLYSMVTNDILKHHTLNRRVLDTGSLETLYFTQILLPPYRKVGHIVPDPFDDRLFVASYLVFYNGYLGELYRPGLDVFDLAADDFPRRTFYNLSDDQDPDIAMDRMYSLSLDPVREQLYLLFRRGNENLGSIYRFDLFDCLQTPACEPDMLPVHPPVHDGMSIVVDPCGVDEHPAIDDILAFADCMTGPAPNVTIGRDCNCSDFDEDLRTDLRDVAFLQNLFFDAFVALPSPLSALPR